MFILLLCLLFVLLILASGFLFWGWAKLFKPDVEISLVKSFLYVFLASLISLLPFIGWLLAFFYQYWICLKYFKKKITCFFFVVSFFVVSSVIFVSIVLLFKFFAFEFYRVSGPSMCPTFNMVKNECSMEGGDFVFVNKYTSDINRGDIVVYREPTRGGNYIHRVIGVPGDVIKYKDGEIFLENASGEFDKLNEKYLLRFDEELILGHIGDFFVPEESFLLLGDNRIQALDGRMCYHLNGCDSDSAYSPFIHKDDIVGVATHKLYPVFEKIYRPFYGN